MSSHKSSEKKIGGIIILVILAAFVLIYFYLNFDFAQKAVSSVGQTVTNIAPSLAKAAEVGAIAGA